MEKIILIFIFLISPLLAEETYQDASHICDKCKCSEDDEFILDCTQQRFEHVLANWPPHNKTLIATFSYNNITNLEVLPVTDQKVKLVFDHCNIKYVEVGVFRQVKNVEFIDLSYNQLTTEEIDGEDFRGPYNNSVYYPLALKHLNLAYNQIHSLPRKFFENMPDLEELNLEGNGFNVLDSNTQMALSSLPKLKSLNLANNKLTEVVGDAIKSLGNLIELNLAFNELDFVPETLDYVGKHLQVLNLSNNYLYQLKDQSFLGLTAMKEVYLDNLPKLEIIYSDAFATLPNLRKLYLRNNIKLRQIDREAFSPNQTIEELYLSKNSLRELDYKLLIWTNLKVLELKESSFECSCDLYKIVGDLSQEITRNRDGPICIDPRNGFSTQIFVLKDDICEVGSKPYAIHHAVRHFETIRIIVVTLSTIFIIVTFVAITITVLRYRRGTAYRNYTFTTQVQYNPISQHRI